MAFPQIPGYLPWNQPINPLAALLQQGMPGLANAYGSAYQNYLGGASAQYNNILKLYQDLLNNQVGSQQKIGQGYNDVLNSVMGTISGIGGAQRQSIEDAYAKQAGDTTQGAINRGLGNTTVLDSLQRGVSLDKQKALNDLADRLAQLNAGYRSQIGLSGLDFLNQGNMQNTALGSKVADWMNSLTFQPPDPNAYNQLAQMLGQGAAASQLPTGIVPGGGMPGGGVSPPGGAGGGGMLGPPPSGGFPGGGGMGGGQGGAGGAGASGSSGLNQPTLANAQNPQSPWYNNPYINTLLNKPGMPNATGMAPDTSPGAGAGSAAIDPQYEAIMSQGYPGFGPPTAQGTMPPSAQMPSGVQLPPGAKPMPNFIDQGSAVTEAPPYGAAGPFTIQPPATNPGQRPQGGVGSTAKPTQWPHFSPEGADKPYYPLNPRPTPGVTVPGGLPEPRPEPTTQSTGQLAPNQQQLQIQPVRPQGGLDSAINIPGMYGFPGFQLQNGAARPLPGITQRPPSGIQGIPSGGPISFTPGNNAANPGFNIPNGPLGMASRPGINFGRGMGSPAAATPSGATAGPVAGGLGSPSGGVAPLGSPALSQLMPQTNPLTAGARPTPGTRPYFGAQTNPLGPPPSGGTLGTKPYNVPPQGGGMLGPPPQSQQLGGAMAQPPSTKPYGAPPFGGGAPSSPPSGMAFGQPIGGSNQVMPNPGGGGFIGAPGNPYASGPISNYGKPNQAGQQPGSNVPWDTSDPFGAHGWRPGPGGTWNWNHNDWLTDNSMYANQALMNQQSVAGGGKPAPAYTPGGGLTAPPNYYSWMVQRPNG